MGPAGCAAADGTDVGVQSPVSVQRQLGSRGCRPSLTAHLLFNRADIGDSGGLPESTGAWVEGLCLLPAGRLRGLARSPQGLKNVASCGRSHSTVPSAVPRGGLQHVQPSPVTTRTRRISPTLLSTHCTDRCKWTPFCHPSGREQNSADSGLGASQMDRPPPHRHSRCQREPTQVAAGPPDTTRPHRVPEHGSEPRAGKELVFILFRISFNLKTATNFVAGKQSCLE